MVGGVPRAQRKESLEGEEEEEESDADNGTHTAHSGSSDDALLLQLRELLPSRS